MMLYVYAEGCGEPVACKDLIEARLAIRNSPALSAAPQVLVLQQIATSKRVMQLSTKFTDDDWDIVER